MLQLQLHAPLPANSHATSLATLSSKHLRHIVVRRIGVRLSQNKVRDRLAISDFVLNVLVVFSDLFLVLSAALAVMVVMAATFVPVVLMFVFMLMVAATATAAAAFFAAK